MSNENLQRFAALYREKLDLDARLKAVSDELATLQDPLLNYFADMGWEKPPRMMAAAPDTEVYDLLRDIVSWSDAGSTGDVRELVARIEAALAPRPITLYVNTQLWASKKEGVDTEAACAALKANGFEHLVRENYNMQTLSAEARELERRGETFPAAVLEVIEVKPKVDVRGRRT